LYWLFECFGDGSADHSVSAYLDYVSPFQFVDTYSASGSSAAVHSIKGLEFDCVLQRRNISV